jgi:DNA-binding IclR family transcriptional regulator
MNYAGEHVAKDGTTGTQSLDRALALLRIVAGRAGRGIRLSEAVEQSELSKPTVHRLLQALERQGFVTHDAAAKLYHLGPEAFVIGTLANERFGIHRTALPCLSRLAAASQDTCFLTVRRDFHAVCRQSGDSGSLANGRGRGCDICHHPGTSEPLPRLRARSGP